MASVPSPQKKRTWRSLAAFGLAAASVSLFASAHLVFAQSADTTSDDVINMIRSLSTRFSRLSTSLEFTDQACGIKATPCPPPPPPAVVLTAEESTCRITCDAPRDITREQLAVQSTQKSECVDTCLNPPPPPPPFIPTPEIPVAPVVIPPPPAPPAPTGYIWVNGITGVINWGTSLPPSGWLYDPLGGTWGPPTDPYFVNSLPNQPTNPNAACGSNCQYCKTMCTNQNNQCSGASCASQYSTCTNLCNGK